MWTAVTTSWDFEGSTSAAKASSGQGRRSQREPLRHPNASTDLPPTIANRCKTLKQML
jgi:hypothetical protein